jgi:thioredoxin reductase (NADPH)
VRYGSPSGEAVGYDGRRVVVVSGANSAGQAALHLADHAAQVTMLVRGDPLDRAMSRYLVDRIEQHDRITVCPAQGPVLVPSLRAIDADRPAAAARPA